MAYSISYSNIPPQVWRTDFENLLTTEDQMEKRAASIASTTALVGTVLSVAFGITHTVLANTATDNKTSPLILGAVETGVGALLAGIGLYLKNLYNPNNPNDTSVKMRQNTLFGKLQDGVKNHYLSLETAQGIADIYLPNHNPKISPPLSDGNGNNNPTVAVVNYPPNATAPLFTASTTTPTTAPAPVAATETSPLIQPPSLNPTSH